MEREGEEGRGGGEKLREYFEVIFSLLHYLQEE